jgi:hypothetical protein
MPEKNFEEQMEDILGKMQLHPADKVWSEVEKRIKQNNRKRRPIFWLPLFVAAVAGAGIFYFQQESSKENPPKQIVAERKTVDSVTASKSLNQKDQIQQGKILPKEMQKENIQDQIKISHQVNKPSHLKTFNTAQTLVSDKENAKAVVEKSQTLSTQFNNNTASEITSANKKTDVIADQPGKVVEPLIKQPIKTSDSLNKIPSVTNTQAKEITAEKATAPLIIKSPKWENGISFNTGVVSYAAGFNVLNAFGGRQRSADQILSSATPSGNINNTTYVQHATGGYYISAGYFLQRNFKNISIQSGIQLEHVRFTNYQTIKNETLANVVGNASAGFTVISTSFNTNKEVYKFSGFQIPITFSGLIAKGDNQSLLWTAGLPQEFLFRHSVKSSVISGQYLSSSSSSKSFLYQPGLELGMNYSAERNFKFSAGPYFSMGLKKMKVGADQSVNLYKAGIQFKYFLR